MSLAYDFPVELQPVFLRTGEKIEKSRAIVRTDSGVPLATVSDRYRLMPYTDIVQKAENFMEALGAPEKRFWLGKDGARMSAEYTYRERAIDVGLGDLVGLRVYVQGSYDKKSCVIFRVGGMRLSCLNGAVSHKGTFEMKIRHTEGAIENFRPPTPDAILAQFAVVVKSWRGLASHKLSNTDWDGLCQAAVDEGIVPERALNVSPSTDLSMESTAWKLYNKFTYYVNHSERETASRIGKIRRLERIDRFFSKHIQ